MTEVGGPEVKEGMEVVVGDNAESENPVKPMRPKQSLKPSAEKPAVNPAAELKALQGQWKVVRQENGEAADASWLGYFNAGKLDRVLFDQKYMGLVNFADEASEYLIFRVDPTAAPKTIEISSQDVPAQMAALGIYRI